MSRILGEQGQVTFRSADVWGRAPVVPGHLVTLVIERRWTWRGDAYASGKIENLRIDVAKLGLEPLPLEGGELDDVCALVPSPTGGRILTRRCGRSSRRRHVRRSSSTASRGARSRGWTSKRTRRATQRSWRKPAIAKAHGSSL